MVSVNPKKDIVEQIAYAYGVQMLVDQKSIKDPENLLPSTHKRTAISTAEQLLETFERDSLTSKLNELKKDPPFFYGVAQGVVAALIYSVILIVIAVVIKQNGIDLIHAVISSDSSK